ncbi:hypothetical protein YC2023_117479 [Brassica napus]
MDEHTHHMYKIWERAPPSLWLIYCHRPLPIIYTCILENCIRKLSYFRLAAATMLSSLPTPHSHSSFSGGGVNSSSTISRKKMNSCYHTHSSFIKLVTPQNQPN